MYEFVSPDAPHIKWLWEILEEFSQDKRVQFVNFVTARSRLPASVDAFVQPFKIISPTGHDRANPDRALFKTQTCFSKLTVPPMTSKAHMRDRLLFSIENAVTMDADVRQSEAEGYSHLR